MAASRPPPGTCTSRRARSASASAPWRAPAARFSSGAARRAARPRTASGWCDWGGRPGSCRTRRARHSTRPASSSCRWRSTPTPCRRGSPTFSRRSPNGTAPRSGCASKTRHIPRNCCAAVTCSPRSPVIRRPCKAVPSSRSVRCATFRPRLRRSPAAGGADRCPTGRRCRSSSSARKTNFSTSNCDAMASGCRLSSTKCPPTPTSTRPSASGLAGPCCPSRRCTPTWPRAGSFGCRPT
jgi:hypothetical protein